MKNIRIKKAGEQKMQQIDSHFVEENFIFEGPA